MANTILQNVQRGVILLQGLMLALIGTFLTIKLIKKRIDLKSQPRKKTNFKEEAPRGRIVQQSHQSEVTEQNIEQIVVKDSILNDEDTCVQRLMKKIVQLNVQFNPWMMGIMLSFVTATSSGFDFFFYILSIICCLLFNSFKVHRACLSHLLIRWAIQALFPLFCIFLVLNIMVTGPSVMLYTLVQG